MIKPPLLTGTDTEAKYQEIKAYFYSCYRRYESLFEVIADNSLLLKSRSSLASIDLL